MISFGERNVKFTTNKRTQFKGFASLNNTKINCFKFDLAYCLDSAGTSNEGINTMVNLRAMTISRAVDWRKKKMSDVHREYVEKCLLCNIQQCPRVHINNAKFVNILNNI